MNSPTGHTRATSLFQAYPCDSFYGSSSLNQHFTSCTLKKAMIFTLWSHTIAGAGDVLAVIYRLDLVRWWGPSGTFWRGIPRAAFNQSWCGILMRDVNKLRAGQQAHAPCNMGYAPARVCFKCASECLIYSFSSSWCLPTNSDSAMFLFSFKRSNEARSTKRRDVLRKFDVPLRAPIVLNRYTWALSFCCIY